MSIRKGSWLAGLLAALAVVACGELPPAPTPSAPPGGYTLTLSSPTLLIAQGEVTPTTTVGLVRSNFSGNVTLTVENLPDGVTTAFDPVGPISGSSSALTLTVSPTAAPGTFTNLVVRGVAAGLADRTTSLTLTITPAAVAGFTLTTTPSTAGSVTQGSNASVALHINRTGGHTSDVALSATGTLPTGLTLSFLPTSTATNSAVLTITTTAATPVGTYPIVIHGNAPPLGDQFVDLNLVVVAPSGSGNVLVDLAGCNPVWVAYQDGTGPWVRVTGVNDLYRFNITQSKGGVAYVQGATRQSYITTLYYSLTELTAATLNPCGGALPPPGKMVNAMVANLPIGTEALVSFGSSVWEGSGFASTRVNGPIQLTDVLDGPQDLVASAAPIGGPAGSTRIFLARGLNPASGGSLGTVDFTGPGSFAPTAAVVTLAGGVPGETYSQAMYYTTGPAGVYSVLYDGAFSGSLFTAFGITAANQLSTDSHTLVVTASTGPTSFRYVGESFHAMAPRTLTLPSALEAVTASDAGGPYQRLTLATTLPADLGSVSAWYCDQTVGGKCVFITATGGWLDGPSVSLTLPDFSRLAGWSNAWAPATGDHLNWYLSASAAGPTSGSQEGTRWASATRNGTF